MKALITGATSGIGRDIARYLASKKIELILVGRNTNSLNSLKKELMTKVSTYQIDLNNDIDINKLLNIIKSESIDILINGAGFGYCDYFSHYNYAKDVDMINTNMKAFHIIFKETLSMMEKKNAGYILNIASFAGFVPGPMMATYYATKSYVLRLSEAVAYEEKKKNSNVSISILCPGPVKTNFESVANVNFHMKALESEYVAKYAIDKMFKKKLVIIPGVRMKISKLLLKIVPKRIQLFIFYRMQSVRK